MRRTVLSTATAALLVVLPGAPACSDDENAAVPSSPELDGGDGTPSNPTTENGFALRPFTAPDDPGGVLFTISGEALALEGFAFPPAVGQEVTFVDGWDVRLERLLVTVDAITLAASPDMDPADQGQIGAVVAGVDGPWAVDLAKDDPSYLTGKGGEGRAVPLAALSSQNQAGDAPFDTAEGTRYGFGFRAIAASANAHNVNLEVEALEDYERMIAEGCSILYVGTATWQGDADGVACTPAPGSNQALDAIPKKTRFRLCFAAPTRYGNCQNPDNDPADPIGGEEHQRGIAFKDNASVIAQLTIHADHPFWDSVEEDAPMHFDAFAAQHSGESGEPTVTMADLAKVNHGAITDRLGRRLPWRNCVGADYAPRPGNATYLAGSAANVGPKGSPSEGLRHLADFATYLVSTQGHLNGGGLCAAVRDYPSPN
jgi:hypothetical protein